MPQQALSGVWNKVPRRMDKKSGQKKAGKTLGQTKDQTPLLCVYYTHIFYTFLSVDGLCLQVDSCEDTSSNSPSNPQSYSQLKTEFVRTVGVVTNCVWLNEAKCVQFETSPPPVEDGSCRSSSRSWFVQFVSCHGISRSLALVEAGS